MAEDSDDDNASILYCCCSPCIGLCYLSCLMKMKVSTRVKIVWFWMIFLALFGGLYIRFQLYDADTVSISSYDMMEVQKISTFFCEGVTVESDLQGIPVEVYHLNNLPRINYTRSVTNSSTSFVLDRKSTKLFHFYLIASSTITLTFCSGQSLLLVVVEGTERYYNYIETHDYRQYTDEFITIKSGCHSETFDINSSNRYYFLISQNWRKSRVYLNTFMSKASYEIHGKDSKLVDKQPKVFVPLTFQSIATIIYKPVAKKYVAMNVTTRCEPMNYLYVGIFLGGPLTLGLILTYFVKCLFHDPIPDPTASTDPPANASSDNMPAREPVSLFEIHPTAPPPPENVNASTPWLPHTENINAASPYLPPPENLNAASPWLPPPENVNASAPWLPEPLPIPACPPPAYESLFANTADSDPPPYHSTTIELKGKDSLGPIDKL